MYLLLSQILNSKFQLLLITINYFHTKLTVVQSTLACADCGRCDKGGFELGDEEVCGGRADEDLLV